MIKRVGFSGKVGFVLAAAGSAVGLGNIWRFPYLAAKYGGGIFLVTYLVLVLTFGYALLVSENCIGRMTRKSPIGAFRTLCAGKTSFLKSVSVGGWINAIVPLIIIPYYCVIGGWVTKYAVAMATSPISQFNSSGASASYFTSFVSSTWEPIAYFAVFMLVTAAVVAFGVNKGVERSSKILMPILILMIVAVCIYALFLPNAAEGFKYYLKPDWENFGAMTLVAAMGQLFFSLSIAMGIMVTYGSYMKDGDDLVSCVNHVEIFDTLVAFLAGMMIIPAVVSFGMQEAAQAGLSGAEAIAHGKAAANAAGPSLVFVTMPRVFASFSGGQIFGAVFFILVFFAAATSAISLLETNVDTMMSELKVSRYKALAINVIEIVAIGVITVLGYSVFSSFHPLAFIEQYKGFDILDTLDFISNSVLMPIGAIFTTILVVAVVGLEKFLKEVKQGRKWKREYVFQFCMCVIVIPCLLVILLQATGIIK